MDPVESWHDETIGQAACEALKRHAFDARYVASAKEALDIILSFAKPGMTVGFGGSMTIQAIGPREKLAELGAKLLDHNAPGLDPEKKTEIRRAQLTCDLFLSGSNAVTLDGELVNVDGTGNRVAALTFGPRKTVVVVGVNKIVRNLEEAWARIETRAAPMNNRRLKYANPCVKAGTCSDCQGETRICRIYHVLKRRPSSTDFTVIVVGEALGF
ncbi:MAG: lactate utilization protein [Spirochaetota bacterium]